MRKVVVADIETTGLLADVHAITEIAWVVIDLDEIDVDEVSYDEIMENGKAMYPGLSDAALAQADPEALKINDYVDRGIASKPRPDLGDWAELIDDLEDCTLMGANIRFDARFIEKMIGQEPWNHRLFDLQAYAAGVLGHDLPKSLSDIRVELIEHDYAIPENTHAAIDDVATNVAIWQALRDIIANGL